MTVNWQDSNAKGSKADGAPTCTSLLYGCSCRSGKFNHQLLILFHGCGMDFVP